MQNRDTTKYLTYFFNYFTIQYLVVTTQHPIENFSLIKHKLDFAYFHHHYKLFND